MCTDDVTTYMYRNKLVLHMTSHTANIMLYMLSDLKAAVDIFDGG